jgi:transcriptional regulator with XRE-family HTH domain
LLPRRAGGAIVRAVAQRSRRGGSRARRAAKREAEPAGAEPVAPALTLQAVLARGLGALTSGVASRMTSGGVGLGKALLSPEADAMRREAGHYVRELRQLAGLTLDELAAAVELSDRSLLAAVEKGTATLSFDLILRLSSLLARNDPIPFVAKLTRSYNPALWKLLESWGVGRIPLQLERERRFVNVFRSHDVARELSDDAFDHVLAFTQAAFEMGLSFAAQEEGLAKRKPRRRPRQ